MVSSEMAEENSVVLQIGAHASADIPKSAERDAATAATETMSASCFLKAEYSAV
jgi:hypothetical protein